MSNDAHRSASELTICIKSNKAFTVIPDERRTLDLYLKLKREKNWQTKLDRFSRSIRKFAPILTCLAHRRTVKGHVAETLRAKQIFSWAPSNHFYWFLLKVFLARKLFHKNSRRRPPLPTPLWFYSLLKYLAPNFWICYACEKFDTENRRRSTYELKDENRWRHNIIGAALFFLSNLRVSLEVT